MTIGNRIAGLRKSKGFTQEYVAEQLGVSRQAVSKWEQDQTSPDTKNLIILANLLGSSVEYIATGKSIIFDNQNTNHQYTQQCLLLQKKIDKKMNLVVPLLTAGVLVFFLFVTILGPIAVWSSVGMISAAIYQYFSAEHLKKDLDFLNEAHTSSHHVRSE